MSEQASRLVRVSMIERSINPEAKTASHDFFALLSREDEGKGFGKDLMRSNIDFYRRNGISSIDVNAGLDVGGYAWAKYGFRPTQASWDELRASLLDRLRSAEAADIPFKAKARAAAILKDSSPDAIWHLSDMNAMTPFVDQAGDPLSLGKWLLLKAKWTGKMDLNHAPTMERFDKYVGRSR